MRPWRRCHELWIMRWRRRGRMGMRRLKGLVVTRSVCEFVGVEFGWRGWCSGGVCLRYPFCKLSVAFTFYRVVRFCLCLLRRLAVCCGSEGFSSYTVCSDGSGFGREYKTYVQLDTEYVLEKYYVHNNMRIKDRKSKKLQRSHK